jgi:hypothetical protein
MKKEDVKKVLGRVLTWPAAAQKEAVATLRAIEEKWAAGDYHATPEELEVIDEADRSGVVAGCRLSRRAAYRKLSRLEPIFAVVRQGE